MKKTIFLAILTLMVCATSFVKVHQNIKYGFAHVPSFDYKTYYISSVFKYSENDTYESLTQWAQNEFVDNINSFRGRSVIVGPVGFGSDDYNYVRDMRTRMISASQTNVTKVVLVPFPPTK